MDPVSGVLALAGITAASVLGLRWQRSTQEGFAVLPGPTPSEEDMKVYNAEKNQIENARRVVAGDKQRGIQTPETTTVLANRTLPTLDTYPDSVATSQSRYNMFSGLINPINNPLIPVGSSPEYIEETKKRVASALGTYKSTFSKNRNNTLVLEDYTNKYPARSETDRSVFNAIQFCKEAGQQENPFSYGKKPSARSKDGVWSFDEICGVCLTGGTDEEGKQFYGKRGLLYDPNARDADRGIKDRKGYPFIRAKPSLAFCGGAPEKPVFATTGDDLVRFTQRSRCQAKKVIGGEDNCALCFEYDTYATVPKENDAAKGIIAPLIYTVSLFLQGVGEAEVSVNNRSMTKLTLDETKPTQVELTGAKEGTSFSIFVKSTDPTKTQRPTLFGYLQSAMANGGTFRFPLNLLLTKDTKNASKPPNKSGGFYTYREFGMEVAKIQPARFLKQTTTNEVDVNGRPITTDVLNSEMDLVGILPFTFVQKDEFAAYDCPAAPYMTSQSSVNAFATDQPCFKKGSGPGNYSEECLQGRILDVGCTSKGDLYSNALSLNNLKLSLEGIYSYLQGIQRKDMISPEETKLCSGRAISSPCDAFVMDPSKKFLEPLMSNDPALADQREMAKKCISFLYNNKGAEKGSSTTGIGPTYSGLMTYKNNTKERKNIVCLPDGILNPDKNDTSLRTLATYADTGYTPRKDQRRLYGVPAIQAFLNDEFELAVDWSRNANTDIPRKAAIKNCFGPDLSNLPTPEPTQPTMQEDECGIIARYVRVLPTTYNWDNPVEIAQLVVIDKTGTNVALRKSTEGTSPALVFPAHGTLTADKALDGSMFPKKNDFYHSAKTGEGQQFIVDLGNNYDITRIIYFYRNEPSLLYRKNGARLQLLNSKKEVVDEKRLNANMIEEIVYQQEGAPSTCKSFLTPPRLPTLPQGYVAGLYGRFFKLRAEYPALPTNDLLIGKTVPNGWTSQRLGTPSPFTSISLDDGYFGSMNLPEADLVGFVARGFYFANQSQELYFKTESDDGVVVTFNGIKVIDNWAEQAKAARESVPLVLPTEGAYPIEIYWYERYGAATLRFYWRRSDQTEWQTDLSKFFGYNAITEKDVDDQYDRSIRAAEQARLLQSQNAVTVYDGYNYTGRSWVLGVGDYGWLPQVDIPNDILKSIKVSPGYQVVLYEAGSFDASRRVITVSTDIPDLKAFGNWHDTISGLKVQPFQQARGVTLYESANYSGRSFLIAPGDYPWVEAVGIPNDFISSANVPSGFRLIIYEHWYYQGRSVTLTSDTPNFATIGFDNAMSSMRVQKI